MADPSRRFLAMLPPALLAAQPPDDIPAVLALLGAIEEQWLLLAADVDRVSGRRLSGQRRRLGAALPGPAARPAAGRGAGRDRLSHRPAPPRGTPSALEDFASVVTGLARPGHRGLADHGVVPAAEPPSAAHREPVHARGRAPADRDPAGPGPAQRHAWRPGPPGRGHRHRLPVAGLPLRRHPGVPAARHRDGSRSTRSGCPRRCTCNPQPLAIASDAEDELPPGTPPALRPPRTPGDLPLRATWRLIEALGPADQLRPGLAARPRPPLHRRRAAARCSR